MKGRIYFATAMICLSADVTGDDLMSFHAVPHDEDGLSLGRMPGIRRVHWAKTGLPYLEMSEERDLSPEYRHVTLKLTIR